MALVVQPLTPERFGDLKTGFTEVARRRLARPIVRLELRRD